MAHNFRFRIFSGLATLGLMVIVAGCVSVNLKRLYQGDPLKANEATINGSYHSSYPINVDMYANISCIDGTKLPAWNGDLALLPGSHQLVVDWAISNYYIAEFRYGQALLNAELNPNQTYQLEPARNSREFHIALRNKETGEIIAQQLVLKRFPEDYSGPEYLVPACEQQDEKK